MKFRYNRNSKQPFALIITERDHSADTAYRYIRLKPLIRFADELMAKIVEDYTAN